MDQKLPSFFVVRHAESLEDIDKTAYERMADEDMPLSAEGRVQAKVLGLDLSKNLGNCKHLNLILSPCERVLETASILVSEIPDHIQWSITTEALIKKQNWGSITIHNRAVIERERYLAGVLRYQFPDGESGADLLDRFGLFGERLRRKAEKSQEECTLVITHGFEVRVLLKTLLGWTEDYFESLAHPNNCELKRLTYASGEFLLHDEMRINDPSRNANFIQRQKK